MVAPNQNQTVDPTQPPAPGALEPLNQEESRFLTQYFRDFKEDLFAWSAATNIALDALAKWLNHPKIAAYVAALRHHQAQAAKRKCIDLLEQVIDSDEPLPEKRRAATTLLRAIAPPGRSSARRAPRNANAEDATPAHHGKDQQQRASSTQRTRTVSQPTSTAAHATAQAAAHTTNGGTASQHHTPDRAPNRTPNRAHSPTHQT